MLSCYDDCFHHTYSKQRDDNGRTQREQLKGDWFVFLLFLSQNSAKTPKICCHCSLTGRNGKTDWLAVCGLSCRLKVSVEWMCFWGNAKLFFLHLQPASTFTSPFSLVLSKVVGLASCHFDTSRVCEL